MKWKNDEKNSFFFLNYKFVFLCEFLRSIVLFILIKFVFKIYRERRRKKSKEFERVLNVNQKESRRTKLIEKIEEKNILWIMALRTLCLCSFSPSQSLLIMFVSFLFCLFISWFIVFVNAFFSLRVWWLHFQLHFYLRLFSLFSVCFHIHYNNRRKKTFCLSSHFSVCVFC